jgi:small subunit ribosomal protein S1
MRVIKVNKRRGNIVLSRKAVLEEEYYKQEGRDPQEPRGRQGVPTESSRTSPTTALSSIWAALMACFTSPICPGVASTTLPTCCKVGDQIDVKILKFDRLEEKVSLGYKQLARSVADSAAERYPRGPGQAKVVSLTDYGAFVELEEGIEGLIHISEMTWNKRIKHPSKILEYRGSEVEAAVLELDPKTGEYP